MSKHIDYWKNRNLKGYQKAIASNDFLHKNSKELLDILKDFDLIKDGLSFFEIGCGSGRNLWYIWKSNKNVAIEGNDLIKEECFKRMDSEFRDKISFYEIDTLSLSSEIVKHPDVLLSSDHLMHIEPEVVSKILKNIANIWKPNYFLIRDTLVARDTYPIKYVHDFSILENSYENVFEKISKSNAEYTVNLWKRK